MTDEPGKGKKSDKPDKDKPQPRRPGGKTKRIAIRAALYLCGLLLSASAQPQIITGNMEKNFNCR
jgi:hypothetical protein